MGAAQLYFTGSKAHNIAIRRIAVGKGLKLNEYGLFRGEARVAGATEASVYRRLGMAWVEPELREDRGEVEAARARRLPRLVELADLRGDLHAHTTASDGRADLAEMAKAARALGLAYLAITDHTKAARIAGGLSDRAMRRHLARIDEANAGLRGFRLLKSAEVDILEDGRLDLPDAILAELDLAVCSIHTRFGLSREKQTARILKAMDHPRLHVLGHPTGRLLGEREPYDVDLERVIDGAAERHCFVELDSQPQRLDLDDRWCRVAKERGVKVAVSSDAHDPAQLRNLRLGVAQARRGWLGPDDVLNTRPWSALRKLLRR
ncbi:MAG: PHP domain-containing protein [Planctomycetota bacterium]